MLTLKGRRGARIGNPLHSNEIVTSFYTYQAVLQEQLDLPSLHHPGS